MTKEYAQAIWTGDGPYNFEVRKTFGENPRHVDEGHFMVERELGPWREILPGLTPEQALKVRAFGLDVPESGAERIAAERARQVAEEGYTAEHDRNHQAALAWAARCYVENVAQQLTGGIRVLPGADWGPLGAPSFQEFPWPWAPMYWKPTGDPVRDLVKAGALIAAAIDALGAGESGD